jgi:AraC-like DNA-binding protein
MIERALKVPYGLISPTSDQRILNLNGFSVIKSYTFTQKRKGTLFLEDHLLLFVQHGIYTVSYGGDLYTVHKNEMVLLKKSISIQYQKTEDPDDPSLLEYKMFFLKDDLLREFFKMANIKPKGPKSPIPISVKPVNERLIKYVESLEPYFKEPEKVDGNLIKLKLLELLYDLAATDENLMGQLMQLKQQVRTDIPNIVEENILNPVSLNDLAYLSGRSLSGFKRDFQAIYNMPPYHWLRERRLDRARELLLNTSMSVTDICFMTGFENITHFSRAFKEYYGRSPVSYKQKHNCI